ncbi:MAG: hypothetical protein H0W61_08785 [Bacteroidetes bacterium]|nr:hypothetical protein [Bacteroidota bacterium]
MKTNFILTGFAALTVLFISCKKPDAGPEGPQGPQGNSGPALTGNLKGYINHFDVAGAKVTTDLANDSVYLDGTGKSAVTDANGLFTFSGISTGVYNMTVKKAASAYGYTKVQNIEFAGNGDTYRNGSMSATPSNSVSTLLAFDTTISSVNYIRIKGTLPASSKAQSVIVFFNAPGSTAVNAASNSTYYILNVLANATAYAKNIATSDLYDLGFISGNTAYIAAYTIGSNTNASSFVDFTTNRTVFTAISSGFLTAQAPVQ